MRAAINLPLAAAGAGVMAAVLIGLLGAFLHGLFHIPWNTLVIAFVAFVIWDAFH